MKGNNKFISKILFKLLLLRGGCSDYTMMKAIQKDKTEVVKLLLKDKRVELFAKDEAINCISAFSRNDDIKFLLEKCKFDN